VPSSPHVAVIDDDGSLRDALVALIRSVGYAGAGYGSAEAFLESDEAGAADCLITDIQLPGLSGIDLALKLRGMAKAPPVIIITARTEATMLARAAQTGALCVLRKPFAAEDLLACLERALASREA
jgi:FixJ family two-component response regulator